MSYKYLLKPSRPFIAILLLSGCQLMGQLIPELELDDDQDGISNFYDVDDDGDGLIEIYDAEGFNNIRNVPDGSGYKSYPFSPTNQKGCGSSTAEECHGYELRADLDLRNLGNWVPIGQNYIYEDNLYPGTPFSALFDGNGHSIRNMRITEHPFYQHHQGIFGMLNGAIIKNLRLHNVKVTAGKAAGALAGHAQYSRISGVTVTDVVVSGKEASGGIVGYGENVYLYASAVRASHISPKGNLGGLIGDARNTTIHSSYSVHNTIKGTHKVGGLVGNGHILNLFNSYSARQELQAQVDMGGLIGYAWGGKIRYSYAANIGLGGFELGGGLVGQWINNPYVDSSYWDQDTSGARDNGYGLAKKTTELQNASAEFYADWLDGEDIHLWCDQDGNGRIEEKEQTDDNRIWHFSDSPQYPSIRCVPGGITAQHN